MEIKHVRDKKKIEIRSFLYNINHLFVIASFKLWIPNELAKVIDYLWVEAIVVIKFRKCILQANTVSRPSWNMESQNAKTTDKSARK